MLFCMTGNYTPKALEAMGAIVDDIGCYKTVPETEDVNGAAAQLLEDGADFPRFEAPLLTDVSP